jgi:DnaJ-domain-containing protein 1
MRDPFSWFEQQFAKQQQQQQQQQGYQQRSRQQQQQQQSWQQLFGGGGGPTAGPRGDSLGYYSTLGVKPGCSTQEIQSAFRGLALKHHPDRYSSAADKEKATKKFQVSLGVNLWVK